MMTKNQRTFLLLLYVLDKTESVGALFGVNIEMVVLELNQ